MCGVQFVLLLLQRKYCTRLDSVLSSMQVRIDIHICVVGVQHIALVPFT